MSEHFSDFPPSELSDEEFRAAVDAEVSALRLRIRELHRRRNERAPIYRLPNEILSLIFLWHRDLVEYTYSLRPSRWMPQCTRVCSAWRAAAMGCHELWSRISINYPGTVKGLLERSGSHPLAVSWSRTRFESAPSMYTALDQAMSQLHRIAALHINVIDGANRAALSRAFPEGSRAPLLSKFHLDDLEFREDDGPSLPRNVMQLLAQEHLHLSSLHLTHQRNIDLSGMIAQNMKVLDLDASVTVDHFDWHDILENMPLLEHLRLCNSYIQAHIPTSQSPRMPLSMPSLRIIELEDGTPARMASILGPLLLNSLHYLNLWPANLKEPTSPEFFSCIQRVYSSYPNSVMPQLSSMTIGTSSWYTAREMVYVRLDPETNPDWVLPYDEPRRGAHFWISSGDLGNLLQALPLTHIPEASVLISNFEYHGIDQGLRNCVKFLSALTTLFWPWDAIYALMDYLGLTHSDELEMPAFTPLPKLESLTITSSSSSQYPTSGHILDGSKRKIRSLAEGLAERGQAGVRLRVLRFTKLLGVTEDDMDWMKSIGAADQVSSGGEMDDWLKFTSSSLWDSSD